MTQAMDELTETNNFNLWKHCYLLYQQIKAKSRTPSATFFLFFSFFDDKSVLKPMQWQKVGKCLI